MFGGSFDPPHNAHVALARAALDALELDELRIVPTGHAWHKSRELTQPGHRLAMARLAFGSLPGVVVDARETERAGPTYTVDTLEGLQAENPQAQLYLIMGSDQFAAFRSWHRWQAVMSIAIICIATRALFMRAAAGFDAFLGLGGRFCEIAMPELAVSATEVRRLAAQTADSHSSTIADMVPPAVAGYIARHRLYRHIQSTPPDPAA